QQQTHLRVTFHRYALPAGGPKRSQTCILEFSPLGLGEKFNVFWVRSGPAPLDVMKPESIEFLGDSQFVDNRKIDPLTLAAIAQGRVVKFYFGFHLKIHKAELDIHGNKFLLQGPNRTE